MNQSMSIETIEKEQISGLRFVSQEVLSDPIAIAERKNMLERAMAAGNLYKNKMSITFETLEGTKKVDTTVWNVAEKYISLKGGANIPIHCIVSISV